MENTCKPMAVSFQCMTKLTTNKKINKLIKKKQKQSEKQLHCHFTLVLGGNFPRGRGTHDRG